MKYILSEASSVVEASLQSKLTEAAVRISKADISKVNGLFPQKFKDRFGFSPIFVNDIDMNMKLVDIPSSVVPDVIQFLKDYGADAIYVY
jgi:hypothetical protein